MGSSNRPPRTPDKVSYFDAHNHLQDEWLAPHLERAIGALEALPIAAAVVNGTCEQDWPKVAELRRRHAWVKSSYGLHPWLVGNRSDDWETILIQHLDADPTAAVGEIGLDRWILESARGDDVRLAGLRRAPLAEQKDVFARQLEIAAQRNLPVTIHCLDAWGALQSILSSVPLPERGFLLHAYGGPVEMVPEFVRRGAYFSFNGYFLDPRKLRQQRVFNAIPPDRLLIETDAPSMPLPQAWRTHKLPPGPGGTTLNHPGNIEAVYSGFAAVTGAAVSHVSAMVEANFQRLFGA